jgi:effector-binding domain-containing protein
MQGRAEQSKMKIKDKTNSKKIKNKKALSQVIANLMMILLILIAIGTIWIVVKKVSDQVQYSPEIQCMKLTKNPSVKILKACFNEESNDVEIVLKREIDSLRVNKLKFDIDSSEWCCGQPDCMQCLVLNPSSTKTYFFDFSEQTLPKRISLFIDECLVESENIEECN